jgi:hypothetical protein
MPARCRTCALQLLHVDVLQPVDEAPRRGVRGHGAEEIGMIAQRAEVGQAVATVGDHHRQVAQDGPRVMLPHPRKVGQEHPRQRLCQPAAVSELVEEQTAGMAGDALAIGGDVRATERPDTLHLQSASCAGTFGL